jgi:hypothetical protein
VNEELTTERVREIAEATMEEWLDGYQYSMNVDGSIGNQIQLRRMADGSYRADPGDGPRAHGTLGTFKISVTVERVPDV